MAIADAGGALNTPATPRPQPNLNKKLRLREDVIRVVLLSCALVSVLTTIAIVVVLGTQALNFFTSPAYLDANKQLIGDLDTTQTRLSFTGGGKDFAVGDDLQLGGEHMRIIEIPEANVFVVERGIDNTPVENHPNDQELFAIENVSFLEFISGTKWQPQAAEFGILPLVSATITTSIIAMLVAGPFGLAVAIYLSEYASAKLRSLIKPILELLAGIPTVVYGYFAITFITPLLRLIFNRGDVELIGTYNMLAAGLAMGIMIIPTISSISEDALSAVPRALREASYGLGATKFETAVKVLLPAALSGILAAFILGISRAVGETMIVAVAAGAGPNFTVNPFAAAETMTGHIARISTGDLSFGSIDYNSIYAIALTLFLVTLVLNLLSNAIRRRFRETYA
jgi:phosphate transport system permease protein